MNIHENKQSKLIILVVVFIMAVGIVFLLIRSAKERSKTPGGVSSEVTIPSLVPVPKSGKISLRIVGGEIRHAIGDYLTLEVAADSEGADIAGYDIIFQYDKKAFELVSSESQIADFQLYKFIAPGLLTITGAKRLSSANSNIWTGQNIVKITLKPLRVGKFGFSLLPTAGHDKTQMVDSQTKVHQPELNQVSVNIY